MLCNVCNLKSINECGPIAGDRGVEVFVSPVFVRFLTFGNGDAGRSFHPVSGDHRLCRLHRYLFREVSYVSCRCFKLRQVGSGADEWSDGLIFFKFRKVVVRR